MGGAVSELRSAIYTHVLITKHYPLFLEPYLAAVQFFLRTAESGEGTNQERQIDEIPFDVVITDKRIFEEASTEVELLVENAEVTKALLQAVETYRQLILSPDTDPIRRWYDPPWRKGRPMPQYVIVPPDEVPRFQVAVLRSSVRCLRLMMCCTEAKKLLEDNKGPEILNRAVLENPLDDFVKKDVKAIFSAVYGGENAVRRIAISNVPIVVEMMNENAESAIVQLAGVQRICDLLLEAKIMMYKPAESPKHAQTEPTMNQDAEKTEVLPPEEAVARDKLLSDLDSYNVVSLVTETLNRFDVDRYLAVYVHVCRFVSYVAIEERNTKIVGQCGGVEGSIRLLFRARELQREKRAAEKEELARQARLKAMPHSEWSSILDKNIQKTTAPPPPPVETAAKITNLESLAVVDFTPTEIGQQAIWSLDLLATLDFNVSMMKLHRLKYLLEEIRLDPEHDALGAALIVTRRLRLIRWDEIGLPPGAGKEKKKNP
ncbi:hypothetical protein Poli38472_012962 [Pythium oligandrum]|uniref:Uncharacterized protein n=1 Tax=Pythium oligandrum TaxID=41045 RepID=A0A8K1CKI4_PYTOL|nr:hypothetical protein Poli38472_012962 [Pythium oligandrum]|eukprot:TMW64340.1 hypothetical protein Poli38472_012962 [Pythium oligandrum]